MKFAATVSALAAFVATVVAQAADFDPVNIPEENAKIPAGKPFEVSWDVPEHYKDGTVSIHLIGGKDQGHQVPLADLASGIPNANGKYTWDVSAELGAENIYGLIVKWEKDTKIFQYSKPFHIVKSEGENYADETKTISKAYGTKTISLQHQEKETTTSCPPTSTLVYPPQETTETPTPTPIVTPPSVHTTIIKKPTKSAVVPEETTTVEEPEVGPTSPAAQPEVPASGASSIGASAVALVGAFVVAALAL